MGKKNVKKRGMRTEMAEMDVLSATEMTGAAPMLLPPEQQALAFVDLLRDGKNMAAKGGSGHADPNP